MNIITRSKFPISNVRLYILRTNLNINFSPISINGTNQSTSLYRLCNFQCFSNISASKSSKKEGLLHQASFPIYQNLCWKSSKSKKKKSSIEDSDDDSDEDDEWVLEKGPNFKDVKARIPSLRLDAIIKAGFGLSRNKVEESFYGNKIKVNKKKPAKKSQMIYVGDSVDFIRSSTTDTEVEFGRITLMKVGEYDEGSDKISVLLRKYPKLIGDYKGEPDL